MKTWCGECDLQRAYVFGRIAGVVGVARTPPEDYDADQRHHWCEGYDREQRRKAKLATPDRPQS